MSSEHNRSSPISSPSPARAQLVSRPHWPWSTYSHRSQASTRSTVSSPAPTVAAGSWESNRSSPQMSKTRSGTGSIQPHYGSLLDDTTRHWSYTAFEWVVRDVQKLRDFVEGQDSTHTGEPVESDHFEILRESPMLGEGKFKLEIARTPLATRNPSISSHPSGLSLYITSESLMVDLAHGFEMAASMMVAIKCQDDRIGVRGARADWVWEHWQNDWEFRQESEVWECPLPTISSLLENPRIRDTNSFVICVQIHCPVGPFYPQQPSAYYVPRDLLSGLEAMLDNANTGDVQFICLERCNDQLPSSSTVGSSADASGSGRSPSASSSASSFSLQTTARKRIIYAHSDILLKRSEYFATMLNSSFSENTTNPGERKVYAVVVEEADFNTIYWLLKWVYANWLLFKREDDPRVAVEGVGAGWSARWLHSQGDEWNWKTFRKGHGRTDDEHSVASGASTASDGLGNSASLDDNSATPVPSSTRAGKMPASLQKPTQPMGRSVVSSTSAPRRATLSGGGPSASGLGNSQQLTPRTKPTTMPTTSSIFSVSPRSQRHSLTSIPTPDPHVHPTPELCAASALSVYQVAHRYAMPGLASLALEHMMSTITPQSSFALLLATSVWDDLRTLVEDYIVDKWDEVSTSEEFEECCREVAAGEWGESGGRTLMNLFRRLRSPSTS